MSLNSSIEWCDATWNPVRGCVKISPGCARCYASTFAERWRGVPGHAYEQGFDLRLVPEKLQEPLKWKKPQRVFVNSMSDLFQDGVPDQFIIDVFGIMVLAHWHTFQVLTKRPERMLKFLYDGDHGIIKQFVELQQNGGMSTRNVFAALSMKHRDGIPLQWPAPNIHIGVSAENQKYLDERFVPLAQIHGLGWKTFASLEPLLGPIDFGFDTPEMGILSWLRDYDFSDGGPSRAIDWCIVGGESGPGARPFNVQWAFDVVEQCRAAGIACFVKQLGSKPYDVGAMPRIPRLEAGQKRDSRNGNMEFWDPGLRVREFPK